MPSGFCDVLLAGIVALAIRWAPIARAGDILRGGTPASSPSGALPGASSTNPVSTANLTTSGVDMLARTTQALSAVRQMQLAARELANSGANNLLPSLPSVPANSFGVANGLIIAPAVPKDLSNPAISEDPTLWTGANLPTVATTTSNGTTTQTVTVQQTQEQAVLNWQAFNVGKNTVLNFDQSAGGANVNDWIAFNKIGVTGSPSQILGSINAAGQVYLINPNGIIFGGSSQVNTHSLVASSLPINDNLIGLGLLNNPDAQYLFSALPLPGGANGTPPFTPTMADQFTAGTPGNSPLTYTLNLNLRPGSSPSVAYTPSGSAPVTLVAGTDYTVSTDPNGKATVTFSAGAAQALAGSLVNLSYTPVGDQYGKCRRAGRGAAYRTQLGRECRRPRYARRPQRRQCRHNLDP